MLAAGRAASIGTRAKTRGGGGYQGARGPPGTGGGWDKPGETRCCCHGDMWDNSE